MPYIDFYDNIIQKLVEISGASNVLTEESDKQAYAQDESPIVRRCTPIAVIKPANTSEVSKILKLASSNRIPIIPRGSGTGLSGGAIPLPGSIVLSTERMNHILEIDKANQVAVVEAGVRLNILYEEVQNHGLNFPLHPGEMSATVGGVLATNAGGMNAVKYGVTRHHVLGLEAVLPDGTVINCGGKYVKSSTGYNLTQILIGSEGTLAVITQVILKLSNRISSQEIMFVPFHCLENAIETVPEILKLPQHPDGLEFIEKDIINIIENYIGKEIPYHEYSAFLLIIIEAESNDKAIEYFSRVEEICLKHGAPVALIPDSSRAKKNLIEVREMFYPALKKYAPMEVIDVVVPRSEIARFVRKVKEIGKEFAIPIIAYGHAGDGNVHLHPLCINMTENHWHELLPMLQEKIYLEGIKLGGTISGEHGIGLSKKTFLKLQFVPEQITLFQRIKNAFDPLNIMNPGKIFD